MSRLPNQLGKWALTVVIGFGLGYSAIWAGAYWEKQQARKEMVRPGDYSALFSQFEDTRALMVVQDGCPWCKTARAWLANNGMAVTEVDIEDRALSDIPVPGTPTLLLVDEAVVGFDEAIWSDRLKGRDGIYRRP